ncbi:hypothetical protein [Microbacterium sp. MYb64]|uniref:hypothetical protein n=1 Tax=Microbacterium sp. MYb64 TaxID=1848691 RepID=UPI000CFBF12B|nr:hypothetical protein [Microbacterium sp. MYb64]PRB01748.1 hypothetical protein CQ044_16490 [Microbacterium sp. MYb64]
MTGTTTVGSIDGNVNLAIERALENLDRLKRAARELGQEHPTIDVDANTGKAQASMAAVDAAAQAMGQSAATAGERVKRSANDVSAAQAKVAAANQAADVAYEKARIAQLRLSEAQESGRAKASTMAAAELAVAEALGRLEKANMRATAAEVALEQAQQETANAALKQAAASEVAAAGNDKVADSAGRANARTQLIIAAVVALTAVAAPLTGALVGVAGGLAGLGAAGVLGIIGAVQAVKQGTQAGAEWSAGLKTLKADMSALAATASSGLLTSFQRSVALINASMPQLNSEVAGFTRILGTAGVTALQGAITALHVLNPLFVQGAGVVQDMANGFSSWASNGGLQRFADYAQSVLPQVIGTIGDLASAILHIAEATAPIGTVVLATLDGIANAINAIPVPVLTVMAGAAIAGYTAFMLWKGVTGVLQGVQAVADTLGVSMRTLSLAGGAVGIALTALAVVFTAVAQANAEADARAKSYADTLDKATGQVTQSTRELVAEQLSLTRDNFWTGASGSAVDAAKKLGISVDTVTAAYMGNKAAIAEVQSATEKYIDSSGRAGREYSDNEKTARLLRDVVNEGAQATADGTIKQQEYAQALNASSTAQSDTRLTAQGAADAFQKEASAADEAMSKLNGLIDATNRLNGIGQSAEETNARWQKSLAGITEDAQKQRDAFEQANGTLDGFSLSLDAATASGSANRSMLTGAAADAQAATKAQFDLDIQTMSSKDATDKYAGTLAAQRQAFIDSAGAAGFNADEVQKLADKVFGMPSEKKLEILANTGQAQSAIDRFVTLNDRRRVTVFVDSEGGQSFRVGNTTVSPAGAYGGTASSSGIQGLAMGGTGGTVRGGGSAWSDTAGMYRLANGEEVTSNTVGQAGRWRSLLKAINRNDSAGQVAGQAARIAGVTQTAPSVMSGGDIYVTVQVTGVQQTEPGVLGAIAGGAIKRSLVGVKK